MPSYDKILGALLVGTWANSLLYMLELTQMVYYFKKHYSNDRIFIRASVCSSLLFDTVCTFASYTCVYLYTVTHWGDVPYLANQYWPIPVYIASTGLTATIVQTYLIIRFWTLSRNRTVFIGLLLLLLISCGGSVAVVASLILFPTYEERSHILYSAIAWLITSACADVFIAVSLVLHLVRKEAIFRSTKTMISKLVSMSVGTGCVTALFAILVLANYVGDLGSNVTVGFGFCLGRVYTLTMLYNLNNRHRIRQDDPMINVESIHLSKIPKLPVSQESTQYTESSGGGTDTMRNMALMEDGGASIPLKSYASNVDRAEGKHHNVSVQVQPVNDSKSTLGGQHPL